MTDAPASQDRDSPFASLWGTVNLTSLISITILGSVFGFGMKYAINIVIARELGPEALGTFAFGLVVLNLAALLSRAGLDSAVKKFIPLYRRENHPDKVSGIVIGALLATFVAAAIIGAGLYLGSAVINRLLTYEVDYATRIFFLGVPLFAVMTVGVAASRGFIETKYAVYAKDIGQAGSALLFITGAVVVVGNIKAVAVAYVLSLAVGAILTIVFLARQGAFDWEARLRLETRRVLSFSIPLMLVASIQYLLTWTDVLMLSFFLDSRTVGTYQAAYQTAAILGFILGAANSIFPPVISDYYNADKTDQLQRAYGAATKWITYLTAFGFLFLTLYSDTWMGLFGEGFTHGRTALVVLAVAMLVNASVGPVGYLLSMSEYEYVELVNSVALAALNIVLNYLLIQRLEVLGAAVATAISLTLLNLIRVGETWIFLGIRPTPERYGKGVIALTGAGIVMYVVRGSPLSSYPAAVIGGLGALAVFVGLFHLFGPDPEDYFLVKSL